MRAPEPFSIFHTPLAPRMIVEASAGTGKTYTIVGVAIRMLLIENVPLEKLLIVTFTRLATKELKDRVNTRLREVLRALEQGEAQQDPFLEELLTLCPDRELAAGRVSNALLHFDEVRIVTIHSFCQQVLGEASLMAGTPFDLELVQDDPFLIDAAEDFWREFIHRHSRTEAGKSYISKVMTIAADPATLLTKLKPLTSGREAELETAGDADPTEALEQLIAIRREMRDLWGAERPQILAEMEHSHVKGITAHLASRAEKMEAFLADDPLKANLFEEFKYFLPDHFSSSLKKNGHRLPDHPFFLLCEAYQAQWEICSGVMSGFLSTAAERIRQLRSERIASASSATYDDLVLYLRRALESGESGRLLAEKLRVQYPVALVDEFQDTDPDQYRIFEAIYPADQSDPQRSVLMMIGDPKQAIYGFRGADLYAYLHAREEVPATHRYTLRKNFRSRPALVDAVNQLFSPDHGTPFLEEAITYHPIEAGLASADSHYLVEGVSPVPVQISLMEEGGSKEVLRPGILDELVRQVAELMGQGRAQKAVLKDSETGEMRPLAARDIAILVHSNMDAESIRNSLKRVGIRAVTYSREKVFRSREAERLDLLLSAILDPDNDSRLAASLASGFFGSRLSGICDILESETQFQALRVTLQRLNEVWHSAGVLTMIRKLLYEEGAMEQLSTLHDSERVLTNIQQLSELASWTEQDHSYDPPELLRWFRRKMEEESGDDEETLRLESDENLVKIITIHSSKGLEFPIVFCPTLWEARDYHKRGKTVESFHRTEPPYRAVLNLEQRGDRRKQAVRRAHFEEVCEEVRKCYVALTRAQYECRIFWGETSTCNLSGLGALLLGKDQLESCIRSRTRTGGARGLSAGIFEERLGRLAGEHPDLFVCRRVASSETDSGLSSVDDQDEQLSVRPYNGKAVLKPARSVHSFSSLVSHNTLPPDEPDYEQHLDEFVEYAAGIGEARAGDGGRVEASDRDLFSFPRGKEAGTFIHKLFEHEQFDFRSPDLDDTTFAELLEAGGIARFWLPVLRQMLSDVARADYGELHLDRVPPSDMLREMEFTLPAREPRLEEVLTVVRNTSKTGEIPASNLLGTNDKKGFLTGFIDLIVRQNGRYYILDYKSNHLGDSEEAYSPDRLEEEMISAGYDLQYYLYTYAFRQFMERRVPQFSYDRHFGGVYYLFVRGMREGSSNGIYFDRPESETLHQLAEVLNRE